ncbi:hypothetical protein HDK64DRAFT_69272 [Phyllosticta capitalensis]
MSITSRRQLSYGCHDFTTSFVPRCRQVPRTSSSLFRSRHSRIGSSRHCSREPVDHLSWSLGHALSLGFSFSITQSGPNDKSTRGWARDDNRGVFTSSAPVTEQRAKRLFCIRRFVEFRIPLPLHWKPSTRQARMLKFYIRDSPLASPRGSHACPGLPVHLFCFVPPKLQRPPDAAAVRWLDARACAFLRLPKRLMWMSSAHKH